MAVKKYFTLSDEAKNKIRQHQLSHNSNEGNHYHYHHTEDAKHKISKAFKENDSKIAKHNAEGKGRDINKQND